VESAGVVDLVDEAGKVGCNVLEGFVCHQIHGFDCLLVATPVSVERMNQLELESEQPSSKAAVNTNKCLIQVSLTVLEESSGMSRIFVEHCEAVAAEADVTRRWLG
jgi:hypothetical protein